MVTGAPAAADMLCHFPIHPGQYKELQGIAMWISSCIFKHLQVAHVAKSQCNTLLTHMSRRGPATMAWLLQLCILTKQSLVEAKARYATPRHAQWPSTSACFCKIYPSLMLLRRRSFAHAVHQVVQQAIVQGAVACDSPGRALHCKLNLLIQLTKLVQLASSASASSCYPSSHSNNAI